MWKCLDCATPQLCAAEYYNCGHDKNLQLGWIVKWRSYFGDKTGKVVDAVKDGEHVVGYYISEHRSTQGFPGVGSPIFVGWRDVIEVVSHG